MLSNSNNWNGCKLNPECLKLASCAKWNKLRHSRFYCTSYASMNGKRSKMFVDRGQHSLDRFVNRMTSSYMPSYMLMIMKL